MAKSLKDHMYERAAMSNGPKPKGTSVNPIARMDESFTWKKTAISKTAEPIYTSNPNDKRIKSYSDSLNLYNKSKNTLKKIKLNNDDTPLYIKKGVSPKEFSKKDYDFVNYRPNNKSGRYDLNMNPKGQKIKPIGGIGISNRGTGGGWIDIYKKPVQPVKYQKPASKPIVKDTVVTKPAVSKPMVKDTVAIKPMTKSVSAPVSKPAQKIPTIKSSNNYGDTGTVRGGPYVETKSKMPAKKAGSQFKTTKKNYN